MIIKQLTIGFVNDDEFVQEKLKYFFLYAFEKTFNYIIR